jgi:DNA-binding SARP family transcriptional activator
LDLKFLGPPEIFYHGKSLQFATRKALALFAYLVVETGGQPREKLMGLFWPESRTHLAQSALRNTLARIQGTLRGVNEPLQRIGNRVAFNPSIVCSLDLDLVAQATEITLPTKIAPATIVLLQRATQVVRGPFMDGLSLPDAPSFDEWLTIQRANWRHRQNLLYDRLSLHQLENHLIQPAIETVSHWLVLDSLNEVGYQRLMRLHFLNGDRSAALQTYETCRDLLEKELSIQPSEETEETMAYIRSGQNSALVTESGTEAREAFYIPFVGRSNEYQGLVRSFHLVKKGKSQIVVVSGESGTGKTRLLDEFLKWAGTEGADILRGRAFETSGQLLSYQPIIDALRERLERENAPEDLLDDAWLAELTRILPELRERYPDLPLTTSDDSTARIRLFEAIARLVEALSARHPLIWLMDDLQWADVETLELLNYLIHHGQKGHSRILLLIIMSSEALGHGTKFRDWIHRLKRDIIITHFPLKPLQASDIQELIQALAGKNAAGIAELSAWFAAETAGRPFFLTESLSALDECGALVWDEGLLNPMATLRNLKSVDVLSLAPAIRNVVLSRLQWLSQSASALLSAASVVGRNCSFELLSQISGINEVESLNALDELLSAGLILELGNESRPYTVFHDRIREIVYAQLSTARQQTFHRRALSALTEQKAPAAELAHHALSAKEWELAFKHSLSAGDEAMRLYAVAGAIHHYETARLLLNEKKVDAEAVACQHLYTQLGKVYELEFRLGEALTIYEEMQAQASIWNNRKMGLAALVARARSFFNMTVHKMWTWQKPWRFGLCLWRMNLITLRHRDRSK